MKSFGFGNLLHTCGRGNDIAKQSKRGRVTYITRPNVSKSPPRIDNSFEAQKHLSTIFMPLKL